MSDANFIDVQLSRAELELMIELLSVGAELVATNVVSDFASAKTLRRRLELYREAADLAAENN